MNPGTPDIPMTTNLSAQDREALDALVEAGFDESRLEQSHAPRATTISRLLSSLAAHCPLVDDEALRSARTRSTCDAIRARAADLNAHHSAQTLARLIPEDDDALEALISAGWDAESVTSGMRERARRQLRVLGVLDAPRVSGLDAAADRESLIASTLAHVQSGIAADESRRRLAPSGERREGRRWRLPDIASVAAVLLIGTAILWPVGDAMRARARQAASFGNLGLVAQALGSYASANTDMLPMASAAPRGTTWWNVGNPQQSNSANLFTLVRTGYVSVCQLAAPGNPHATTECAKDWMDWQRPESVSYSFVNLFGNMDVRRGWQRVRTVILADRSPVMVRAQRGERFINVLENSLNHAGFGQVVLFSDASAQWTVSPVLDNGDNIWLPRAIERAMRGSPTPASVRNPFAGNETTESVEDVFLCP